VCVGNVLLVRSILREVVTMSISLKQNFDDIVSTVLRILWLLCLVQGLLARCSRKTRNKLEGRKCGF
jgi:hypothetical protein